MLVMEQQGTIKCLVSDDGKPVTEFTTMHDSPCVIEGAEYRLVGDQGGFHLAGPLGRVAAAAWTSRTTLAIEAESVELSLHRIGRFRKHWELHRGEEVVGTCRVTTFNATAEVPEDLPMPLRVFVFYVAIVANKGPLTSGALWA
jgi:hypothetical protein